MKQRLMMGVLLACFSVVPLVAAALGPPPQQMPPPSPAQATQGPQSPPTRSATAPVPPLRLVEGQPIETRPPELASDHPAFPGQHAAPYHKTVDFNVTVLSDKLKAPWSLQFLSGGRMLITEKPGAMRIAAPNGDLSAPITGLPAINYQGQVGLLDVALDNRYATNHRIYFSYSEMVGPNDTRIAMSSATLDEAGLALKDVKQIFHTNTELPKNPNSANQGGRIAVARDGTLFMTVGDRALSPPWDMAQRLDTDLGKIIHITVDGAPAPGNPYIGVTGALPEIWTSGSRSEEGLAFDGNGQLWETEHGPRGGDELNLIEKGKNYGWPRIVHGIDYPGPEINGGHTEAPGMEQARYYWDPVIAPSGLAFYRGNAFPAWKNSVFVGALGRQMLDRLTLVNGKVVDEEPLLVDMKTRIRDVRVSADGILFVLTDNGKLLKITPK